MTDDISKVLLIQRTSLIVPCSQSIPRRKPDQRHHCDIECKESKLHEGLTVQIFSSEKIVNHPSSRSRLAVINEHLATFKALGTDSKYEQWSLWSFHNDTGLGSQFYDSLSHSRCSNPTCWHMNVLGLLRIAFQVTTHNSLSAAACPSGDTFAIVHALLNRIDSCVRHSKKACHVTPFVFRMKCRKSY